jgi:hypothetical protein
MENDPYSSSSNSNFKSSLLEGLRVLRRTVRTVTTTASSEDALHSNLNNEDERHSFLPNNNRDESPTTYRKQIREFIRRFGNYIAYVTVIVMLILLPIVLYRALADKKVDTAAFNSAWIMVIGTIILSVRLVYLHLTHWYMPEVQKYVVRILWMVPLYAMQSYLSLRYHKSRIYIDSVRDFYEAYVIASFVYYLMALLGGQDALTELLRHKDPQLGQHSFPLSLILEPWELGEEFTLQCKHGVLQYVVIKCIATLLTFLCESANVYGEGKFEWLVAYPYLCFLQNLSVMYALYCLVLLYHAVEAELRHPINWRPLGKFICVKGIVFFCWWQGVIIFYLKAHGIIDHLGSWTSEEVANGLIDYCVVIEMVIFAIAHSYTFTYKEYLPRSFPHPTTTTTRVVETSETQYLYRPPETLPQPMNFQDALWSSTVPRETIKDIKMLSRKKTTSSSICLANMTENESDKGDDEQQQQSTVNTII